MSIKLKKWNSNDELSAKNMNDKVEDVEKYLNEFKTNMDSKATDFYEALNRVFNKFTEHSKETVKSENGTHGLRFFNGKLQYKENEQWVDIVLR